MNYRPKPKAEGDSLSGDPQHRGADSFDCPQEEAPDLQVAPEGVNVVVQQQDLDNVGNILPTVTVNKSDKDDIAEISGEFRNIQVAEHSNVLLYRSEGSQRSEDLSEFTDSHGTRPYTEVEEANKLHYILNCPDGVIQVGKCCILVRVNFNNSLVSRLLDEGNVSVKLQSNDVLLQLEWSNWETKKKEIRSKIKLEITTALEERRPSFEKELIQRLLRRDDNYDRLRETLNMMFDEFGAMIEQITGGCIELWVIHDNQQQLDEMRLRQKEMEDLLSEKLGIKGRDEYQISITFSDETLELPLIDQPQGTRRHAGTNEREQLSEKGISRAEMEEYVSYALNKALKEDTVETPTRLRKTESQFTGGSIYPEPDPPTKIYKLGKEELLGVVGSEMMRLFHIQIRTNIKSKSTKTIGEILLRSVSQTILKDLENFLLPETVIDLKGFKTEILFYINTLHDQITWELNRMSAFEKDSLSEDETNGFKARTKTTVEMCSRSIAALARRVVPSQQSPQHFERLIKGLTESEKDGSEKKEETAEPVVSDTMRLRKEQLLQQATSLERDFLKVELDFYEITEIGTAKLILGTRVVPVSKRALLQSSLQKPSTEATAGIETEACTYGTVVNHIKEDEECIHVHWDNCDHTFMYHETNVKELMRQVPRRIYKDEQVGIGVYVEKGANWGFDDQAGPIGVGTVIRHDVETGLVQVKWHGGVAGWNSYRIGEDVQTRSECFIDEDEPV